MQLHHWPLLGLLFTAGPSVAQGQNPVPCLKAGEKAYTYVEQSPEFPGGQRELTWFLNSTFRLPPADAASPLPPGRVFVRFLVASDGHVCDVQLVKGVSPALDQEVLRVFAAMPAWYPGRQNGEAVPFNYLAMPFSVPPAPVAPRPTPVAFGKVGQAPRFSGAKQADGATQTLAQALVANGLPNDHATLKVPVRFVIDTTGQVTQAVATGTGLDPYFRQLAEQATYRLRWEPGRQKGRPVWVTHSVVVTLMPTYVTVPAK